jgi:hypothetical protein
MSEPVVTPVAPADAPAAVAPPVTSLLQRRLRVAGALLATGLAVEGGTLFALERPVGFLTFAAVGAGLIVAGIAYYLWSIVR